MGVSPGEANSSREIGIEVLRLKRNQTKLSLPLPACQTLLVHILKKTIHPITATLTAAQHLVRDALR